MKKKKTKTGNHWESLASGGESEGSQSERDETEDDIVLQDVMNKAKMEGGRGGGGGREDGRSMHEMLETLAVLEQREREEMLRWYEDKMHGDISKVKRDVGILGIRWMVERKIEENQGMLKEEVMKDGVRKGVFREGNSPNERLDLGKRAGKTFREVYLKYQGYCGWTVRQEKPGAKKLVQFKYFLKRMEDLTKKNLGICGKADEIERQLRDRILQLSCEEQIGKLVRQHTERLGKQEEECRVKAGHDEEERRRVEWADIDVDEPVNDAICMNLGGSVEIEYPQEEQREEQWRQGGQEEQLAEARRREWVWQGGEKTEDDEAEHRERQGNGGGGQGGETKEKEIDMDMGEETVDDEMSTVTFVKGEELGDTCTARKAARDARGTLLNADAWNVNFERKGAAAGGRKGKGSERTGILQDKWDCQALNEAIGEAKWEAGIRINGGIQGPGERNPR